MRAQAAFVSDAEVKRTVDFLAERHEPQFNRELTQVCAGVFLSEDEKDELYDQALRIVLEEQRGSASLLQRALEIGYTRSSRLLDLMRKEGIVGAYKGSKASEVLCSLEEYEARRRDKFIYRYPRGESYQDIILRLDPVIIELERTRRPVMVIAHNAVIRALYAYFQGVPRERCPHLPIPLHSVIELTPHAYGCHESRVALEPQRDSGEGL